MVLAEPLPQVQLVQVNEGGAFVVRLVPSTVVLVLHVGVVMPSRGLSPVNQDPGEAVLGLAGLAPPVGSPDGGRS